MKLELDEQEINLNMHDYMVVSQYISSLKTSINELKYELESAERTIESVEDERDEIQRDYDRLESEMEEDSVNIDLLAAIEEIVNEHYFVSNYRKYDTYQKIIDRLEYILRYIV